MRASLMAMKASGLSLLLIVGLCMFPIALFRYPHKKSVQQDTLFIWTRHTFDFTVDTIECHFPGNPLHGTLVWGKPSLLQNPVPCSLLVDLSGVIIQVQYSINSENKILNINLSCAPCDRVSQRLLHSHC